MGSVIDRSLPTLFINKFGFNAAVGTASETVWDGSSVYTYATAGETLEIVSASATDTSITVMAQGLDTDYALQSATVVTDATAATDGVDLSGSWLRLFRAWVDDSTTPAGNLTIQVSGGGAARAVIQSGFNQTNMSVYTVPAGYSAKLYSYYGSVGKSDDAVIGLYVRDQGKVLRLQHQQAAFQGNFQYTFKRPIQLSEKTDIELRAVAGAGTPPVYGGFDVELSPAVAEGHQLLPRFIVSEV